MEFQEEILRFLDSCNSGLVVCSAGSSEVLFADPTFRGWYGEDIVGSFGDDSLPWLVDCPELKAGEAPVEWECIDSDQKKYYKIESALFEKDGKVCSAHHLVDITEYMGLNRDVTKYMNFFRKLSGFQSAVLEKLSTSYYELLPMLASYYATNRVFYMIQHQSNVDVVTYAKVENQYSNDRVLMTADVQKVFDDDCEKELSASDFAAELGPILTAGGAAMDRKYRCLCHGDVNGQRYAVYLGVWPNTDVASMKEAMILSVIRLYIENGIMRENLIYEKEHDQLTGLYNKGKYLEMAATEYQNLDSIAIFNFDVNNLKKMNDNYGHEMGDKLLIKAADSIRKITSNTMHGYRMGGDEYLLVACNITKEEANVLKDRWEQELARLNTLDDGVECVVALGLVHADKPYNLSEISKQADDLMYEDKKKKKKPGEEIR